MWEWQKCLNCRRPKNAPFTAVWRGEGRLCVLLVFCWTLPGLRCRCKESDLIFFFFQCCLSAQTRKIPGLLQQPIIVEMFFNFTKVTFLFSRLLCLQLHIRHKIFRATFWICGLKMCHFQIVCQCANNKWIQCSVNYWTFLLHIR